MSKSEKMTSVDIIEKEIYYTIKRTIKRHDVAYVTVLALSNYFGVFHFKKYGFSALNFSEKCVENIFRDIIENYIESYYAKLEYISRKTKSGITIEEYDGNEEKFEKLGEVLTRNEFRRLPVKEQFNKLMSIDFNLFGLIRVDDLEFKIILTNIQESTLYEKLNSLFNKC